MITYLNGDATDPIKKPALIIHVCNNCCGWGAGFVLAISRRWPEPEQAYRQWCQGSFKVPQIIDEKEKDFVLGNVQFVPVLDKNIWVANMIAQDNYKRQGHESGKVYLNYDALNKTLEKVFKFAKQKQLTIHMPKIGCGLAGGSWDVIEAMINPFTNDVETFVYEIEV